mmetsp:Transcript_33672/g.67042  ORF Transcript_33672/g.67042 Transcript_33672/m.67042 type:complete len:310 (+) Transcript_33672:910-1839(+)
MWIEIMEQTINIGTTKQILSNISNMITDLSRIMKNLSSKMESIENISPDKFENFKRRQYDNFAVDLRPLSSKVNNALREIEQKPEDGKDKIGDENDKSDSDSKSEDEVLTEKQRKNNELMKEREKDSEKEDNSVKSSNDGDESSDGSDESSDESDEEVEAKTVVAQTDSGDEFEDAVDDVTNNTQPNASLTADMDEEVGKRSFVDIINSVPTEVEAASQTISASNRALYDNAATTEDVFTFAINDPFTDGLTKGEITKELNNKIKYLTNGMEGYAQDPLDQQQEALYIRQSYWKKKEQEQNHVKKLLNT